MAKKIRVWDGSAWQDVAPALPYTAVHSAQASMPSTAVDGQIWLDTDASVPSTTVTRWYKLPSAGTTTLSGNDDNSIPLAYTPGYEQVFLNGTLLSRSAADYTATTGTSVVLSSAIVAGDIVEIICPLQITTTDTYTQSATNAAFQANTNNFAAGKNAVINGAFNVWQRGTTFTNPAGDSYTADRFMIDYGTAAPTSNSVTRQTFTPGSAPIAGYEGVFYFRSTLTTVGTTSRLSIHHKIENVQTYAGQTVTLSFWAKADSARTLAGFIQQNFGSGGSTTVSTAITSQSVTTAWTRFSMQIAVPSISGKTIGTSSFLNIRLDQAVAAGSVLELWGLQLEAGSNATAFQTATGTIQGELAACQRYYFRLGGEKNYELMGLGVASSTTTSGGLVQLPVSMRVAPTSIDYSTLAIQPYGNGTITAISSVLIDAVISRSIGNIAATVASGLTTGQTYRLFTNNSTSGYLGFSAEL